MIMTKLLIILIFISSGQAWATNGHFSLTRGIDFSTGTYGGSAATDVTYLPLIGKYEKNNWLFKLTVPYLRVTGPANVTPNIGQAVYSSNAVRTDSGLGDIVLAGSYSLINSASKGMILDVGSKVKFGTADKYLGLGTGANDYAGELSLYKMNGRFSSFGSVGYKVFGQSLGYTLNNVYYGSVGFSGKFNKQVSSGLIVDYRQASSPTNDPQQMLTLFVNGKINSKWRIQTYVFKGQGVSSPTIGGGAMVTFSN
jgi:hypothetical protein